MLGFLIFCGSADKNSILSFISAFAIPFAIVSSGLITILGLYFSLSGKEPQPVLWLTCFVLPNAIMFLILVGSIVFQAHWLPYDRIG